MRKGAQWQLALRLLPLARAAIEQCGEKRTVQKELFGSSFERSVGSCSTGARTKFSSVVSHLQDDVMPQDA